MKSISQVMTCLLAISFTAQVASAGCLDKTPITQKELTNRIKIAKMQYVDSVNMEKTFADLAKDAQWTSAEAKMIPAIGAAPLAGLIAANYFFAGLVGGSMSYLVRSVGSAAVMVGSVTQTVKSLKTMFGFTDVEVETVMKDLRDQAQAQGFSCSFDDLHKKLADQRNQIIEKDLSGSIYQASKNSLLLGKPYAEATRKLYAISALERQLRSTEIKELSQVRIANSSPDTKPAAVGSSVQRGSF